jgi:hypothetical protein
MRDYRRKRGELSTKVTPGKREFSRRLNRMLASVKNNVDLDLTCYGTSVYVLVISSDERVKNILATAELIFIDGLQKGK